ncbi:MAG: DJ-1/PfpI family protein [Clostridiales bacterium]|nr:DJ-1/PfpI family protein [Clostridiales bacterium]
MKKIAVLFADGTEEIEGVTPVDILRRAGAECDIVSVNDRIINGSHNIKILADKLIDEINIDDYDGIVIAGGMPGATNISNCQKAVSDITKANEQGKLVGAICASPAVVLARHGLIKDKATCYPAPEFIKALGDSYIESDVVVCQNIITANGPKSALKFAFEIVKWLGLDFNM